MDPAIELGRRVSRLTTIVFATCVLLGFAIAVVLFFLLIDLQWRLFGVAELNLTVGASMVLGVGGMVWTGTRVRRALLAVRARVWIDELAGYHREHREELEQIASLWR